MCFQWYTLREFRERKSWFLSRKSCLQDWPIMYTLWFRYSGLWWNLVWRLLDCSRIYENNGKTIFHNVTKLIRSETFFISINSRLPFNRWKILYSQDPFFLLEYIWVYLSIFIDIILYVAWHLDYSVKILFITYTIFNFQYFFEYFHKKKFGANNLNFNIINYFQLSFFLEKDMFIPNKVVDVTMKLSKQTWPKLIVWEEIHYSAIDSYNWKCLVQTALHLCGQIEAPFRLLCLKGSKTKFYQFFFIYLITQNHENQQRFYSLLNLWSAIQYI